jgi:hypothetical protein
VFQDKSGVHRASLDVTVKAVLALRQPKKAKPAQADAPLQAAAPFDDGLPEGLPF